MGARFEINSATECNSRAIAVISGDIAPKLCNENVARLPVASSRELMASFFFSSRPSDKLRVFISTAPRFLMGAACPRLGRARFVAPVSRQTTLYPDRGRFLSKNPERFVTPRAATRALPPSLGLRSVLFTVPFVFVRWRSSEERKQAGNGRKGKNNEIRRDQE